MKKFTNYILSVIILFVIFIGVFYALAAAINLIVPYEPNVTFVVAMAIGNGLIRAFRNPAEYIQ